jgi:hypothetical protein
MAYDGTACRERVERKQAGVNTGRDDGKSSVDDGKSSADDGKSKLDVVLLRHDDVEARVDVGLEVPIRRLVETRRRLAEA